MAPFLSGAVRRAFRRISAGQALIGSTEADLRRIGVGGILRFGTHRITVIGVVPDTEIGGHELLVSRSEATSLGAGGERYMLVDPVTGTRWRDVAERVEGLVPVGARIRIRGPGRAGYLRQADAVLPPVMLKAALGEFAADPDLLPGGWFRIDPAWQATHIATRRVPILGPVTCNLALFPMLRGALAELVRRGLAALVSRDDFGGCFAPRMIRGTTQSIAAHAWGAAVDLNVSQNPLGSPPDQDPRLVRTFERWGFTWGGRWLIPDGMHFQFECFPPGTGPSRRFRCPPGGADRPGTQGSVSRASVSDHLLKAR
jgi:hypothetical protein